MIYIVRHGETDWNKEHRIQGHQDIPLNDKGRLDAKEAKDKLKDIKFDVVFSSPLKRAYETAKIITDNKIIIDKRLIERNNGKLEGCNNWDIINSIPWNEETVIEYDVEPISEIRKRTNEFLDYVMDKYQDKNVLIVTHAGNGIQIRCYFEGEPENGDYGSYRIGNCEVLEYNNSKKKTIK